MEKCDHRCEVCIKNDHVYCSVCRDDADGVCSKCSKEKKMEAMFELEQELDIPMKDRFHKKEENSAYVRDGLWIMCLCGIHDKDSDCEVHLRNIGKYVERIYEKCEKCGYPKEIDKECIYCYLNE